jgi:(p)ppGpp synthase/HD superfamily hydrolase
MKMTPFKISSQNMNTRIRNLDHLINTTLLVQVFKWFSFQMSVQKGLNRTKWSRLQIAKTRWRPKMVWSVPAKIHPSKTRLVQFSDVYCIKKMEGGKYKG